MGMGRRTGWVGGWRGEMGALLGHPSGAGVWVGEGGRGCRWISYEWVVVTRPDQGVVMWDGSDGIGSSGGGPVGRSTTSRCWWRTAGTARPTSPSCRTSRISSGCRPASPSVPSGAPLLPPPPPLSTAIPTVDPPQRAALQPRLPERPRLPRLLLHPVRRRGGSVLLFFFRVRVLGIGVFFPLLADR